jgi:hypothetical protein
MDRSKETEQTAIPGLEWRVIPGWDRYEASEDGQVRNRETGRLMKQHASGSMGYPAIRLSYGGGKNKIKRVHRLVWAAFNTEIPDGMEIDHLDSDVCNNHRGNLECVTPEENRRRQYHPSGDDHAQRKGRLARDRAVLVTRVKELIDSGLLSNRAIGRAVNISHTTVGRIERGELDEWESWTDVG